MEHLNYGFEDYLYGWLLCKVMCVDLCAKYSTLRQYVKMCVASSRYVVLKNWKVWWRAIISTSSIICSLDNLATICNPLVALYVLFIFHFSFLCFHCLGVCCLGGGVNDPSVVAKLWWEFKRNAIIHLDGWKGVHEFRPCLAMIYWGIV